MTTFEEQLRDAGRAATEHIALPPGMAARALAGARRSRRRRRIGALATVAAIAVAAVVIVPLAGSSSPHSVREGSGGRSVQAEAARLLTLASLPVGARSTTRRPPHLTEPPTKPVVEGLVDTSRLVSVPLSFEASLAYLKANPPRGLQTEGGGMISGPGFRVGYRSWSDADAASYDQPQLLVSVEATGLASTVWRLDGQATPPGASGRIS